MLPKLLTLTAALSTTLFLTTAALYPRSYSSAPAIGRSTPFRATELSFINGRLHLWRWTTTDPTWSTKTWGPTWWLETTTPTNSRAYRLPGGTITSSFSLAGTTYRHALTRGPFSDTIHYLHIPAWTLLLTTALLPAWWTLRHHQHRATRARQLGLCPTCHYDLRASPHRCPECGSQAHPTPGPTP